MTKDDPQTVSRIALVDDITTWRALALRPGPLVLIPLGNQISTDAAGVTNHHAVIPVIGSVNSDIELSPIDQSAATEALRAAGVGDDHWTDELGRLGRRSLVALRRRLANKPELQVPSWARPPASKTARRVLLAGRWDEEFAGDRAILSSLTGIDYEELREELVILSDQVDPFVTRVDRTWAIVSPDDAWILLRGQLRKDDLDRLERAVRTVLREVDPALDLQRSERWRAAVVGKSRSYSRSLREGLAESLALLGSYGTSVDVGGGSNGADWVAYQVRELLRWANADRKCQLWTSIADVLPLLAEAAPQDFLDAVRVGLNGDDPLLVGIFQDKESDDSFAPHSPHTELLWALETLAWSSEYFGQAVDLLARLAKIDPLDPGGRNINRPFNSLVSIYCPWYPETQVDVRGRLASIDGLRSRHSAIAWRLMLNLLPKLGDYHHPTRAPRFRDRQPARIEVKPLEHMAFSDEIVQRLLVDVGVDARAWIELLNRVENLPLASREVIRQRLADLVNGNHFSKGRDELWEALRSLIARHRDHLGAFWALESNELTQFDEIVESLDPTDVVTRSLWLFSESMPRLGSGRKQGDFDNYLTELQQHQVEAITAVLGSGGLELVSRLGAESDDPWAVGVALACAAGGAHDAEVLQLLNSDNSRDVLLALGFFTKRFSSEGWSWIHKIISENADLVAIQQARLLLCTGDFPVAWETADDWGADVASKFWELFRPFGLGFGFSSYAVQAALHLKNAGRHAAALKLVQLYAI
jgi:hypothetical protein